MARLAGHTERAGLPLAAAIVAAVTLFVVVLSFAVGAIQADLRERGAITVRDAILNGARQCCAIEGSYPSTLSYLEDHYGVRVDHDTYVVTYNAFADNVMPTVVVVPR